jgi:hypothetical protein
LSFLLNAVKKSMVGRYVGILRWLEFYGDCRRDIQSVAVFCACGTDEQSKNIKIQRTGPPDKAVFPENIMFRISLWLIPKMFFRLLYTQKLRLMKHAMKTGAYETLYENWGLRNTLWKLGIMKHAMKTGDYETRYENWRLWNSMKTGDYETRYENWGLWNTLWKLGLMKHAIKTGAYETRYKNWGLWNTLWKLGLMKHSKKTGAYETRYENWGL